MPKLLVTGLAGVETVIDARVNFSVMENIRMSGCSDLRALCGGQCACATCHVYVDPEFAELLPPLSDDEEAMLDGCMSYRANSRLSCQIQFKAELDGLRVTVASER